MRSHFSLAGSLALAASLVMIVAPPLPAEMDKLTVDLWPTVQEMPQRPFMEIFRPFVPNDQLDATVVILPGGGYGGLSPYDELYAEYFRSIGYTAVVVHYRYFPSQFPAPFADAARAVRLIRKNGEKWGIPFDRIALMGASAGGHLAALLATRPFLYLAPDDDLVGEVSPRPDLLILAYPVISAVRPELLNSGSFARFLPQPASHEQAEEVSPELHVSERNPPTILFHSADDAVVNVENSISFARACWARQVPAELHIFPSGGHGRSLSYSARWSPRWRRLTEVWLDDWLSRL